jgi:hypothetical protein
MPTLAAQTPRAQPRPDPHGISALHWRKAGHGWRLYGENRRRFGKVFPVSEILGMWRTPLSSGRVSDMGNLSWVRAAVMDAAIRELEFEARTLAATTPSKCSVKGGVFSDRRALAQKSGPGSPDRPTGRNSPPEGEAA